jgi:hypothetical protein
MGHPSRTIDRGYERKDRGYERKGCGYEMTSASLLRNLIFDKSEH